MSKPIKLKINYSRIVQGELYEGKNGQYLDLVAWPNKGGPDQYGNTHMVCQEISRKARDAGERGPILGNLTLPEPEQDRRPAPRTDAARKVTSSAPQQDVEDFEIQF